MSTGEAHRGGHLSQLITDRLNKPLHLVLAFMECSLNSLSLQNFECFLL